ncbi:MAG: stage V sporulation protein S [Bacilli bacterium]|nr:stage V sporulation protein S [bacterium]
MDIIKVSSKSISQKVAGSIANSFREGSKQVEIQTVGAGAVNQAIKAISIARGFVAPLGYNLVCTPAFYDVIIDNKEKTAIKLLVETK